MKTRKMREEQAYNDGRMAFAEGRTMEGCSRRSPAQRAAWRRGYEHERRLKLAEQVTPEERSTSRRLLGDLLAHVNSLPDPH